MPPLAASPTGADSRGRGASGAARAGPASAVPGAPPGVAHSAVRMRLAAVRGRWSLDGMCGVGGLTSGREQHARAPPRPLEGRCRAPRFEEECAHPSATSALWRGGGGVAFGVCARNVARPRPSLPSAPPLRGARFGGVQGKTPNGARNQQVREKKTTRPFIVTNNAAQFDFRTAHVQEQ